MMDCSHGEPQALKLLQRFFFLLSLETKEGFLIPRAVCEDKSKQDMSNGYNETKEVCFKIHSCFKSRDKKSHA